MSIDPPDPAISLGGTLLIAAPSLRDPNFFRTVLLLTEHSETEGAHGYVLNRPLGRTVGEVLTDPEFEDLAATPIFLGGPVSTGHLAFASLRWNEGRLEFESHLSAEAARHRRAEGFELRAFVGYSGWSGGQLESELGQDAWIPRTPDRRVLGTTPSERLWGELLESMGPRYRLIARMPEDPSLN